MMHFSQSKSTKSEIFAWNFDFSKELLIVETWNLCHWIWHTSNPKYVPLKPFWCIFPSQNQQNVKFLSEILISQEPLIIDTWNKCHWIWHISNPKYIPLSFWCIFPIQNQQNVKFLPEILIFSGIAYCRDLKQVPLDLTHLKTLNTCHSSHFDAFFPVKINKMWNFCLKFWFFRNHLS